MIQNVEFVKFVYAIILFISLILIQMTKILKTFFIHSKLPSLFRPQYFIYF